MLYMIASLAALGGFLFGYDLGLIAGALLYMEPDLRLSEASEEVIVGMAKLGAVFGTFVGGAVMQEHGRRKAIAWNAAFFPLGPFIMAVGNNAAEVSLGRFIVGMGVGASAVAVPAYVGEMAPKAKRGSVVTVYELMVLSQSSARTTDTHETAAGLSQGVAVAWRRVDAIDAKLK